MFLLGILSISRIQEEREVETTPSLVQLSKDKKFYAVLNLIRRVTPVVSIEEFTEQIDDKSAAEWAASNGRTDIANELVYRHSAQLPKDPRFEILKIQIKKQEHSVEQLDAKINNSNSDIKLMVS
jgi:hypothetical protein